MTTADNTLTVTVPATVSPERLALVETEAKTILTAVLTSMGVLDLTPDFTQRRDALIADARAVAQVQNTEDEGRANAAYKALNALKKEVEAQSTGFKTPLNAAKTRIIDITDAGLEPVLKAQKRLKDMIDGHAAEKIAEQRRQEAERQAAIAKAQAEQRAAEEAAAKLAREQEAARLAAEKAQREAEEAAKRAAKADSPAAKAAAAKAQQEAADAQRKAQEEEAKLAQQAQDAADAADAAAMTPEAAPVAEITHARGVSARMVRDFNLMGDPDAFRMARSAEQFAQWIFTQRPDLARFLKIEVRRADLLEALKDEKFLATEKPPGIRIFEKVASSFR